MTAAEQYTRTIKNKRILWLKIGKTHPFAFFMRTAKIKILKNGEKICVFSIALQSLHSLSYAMNDFSQTQSYNQFFMDLLTCFKRKSVIKV